MPTYGELFGEPTDVLHPEFRIYAIDESEAGVPIRHLSISLTPTQATMEIPRGAPGETGPQGPPGDPWIHMGDRTTAQIAALSLGTADKAKAYRNSDTNALHYWTGTAWIVYNNAFGMQGPQGPQGGLSDVTIEMLPEGEDPVASVTGAPGSQVLNLEIPEKPGPQGATGPASSIVLAEDFDDAVTPFNGAVLRYNDTTDKWYAGSPISLRQYSIPTSAFVDVNTSFTDSYKLIGTFPLDALDHATTLHVTGRFIVSQSNTSRIAIEVRLGAPGPADGTLIAKGIALSGTGEQIVNIMPHYSTPASPATATAPGGYIGVIPATHTGNTGTIYVSVIRLGGVGSWQVKSDYAQVSVLRHS
ncbi:minor tail protein [Gordonia phage Yvonnetastic]|uniref:Minor tail protein n=1 Tax=Gordonia phage Yvonnetastic TaxID=1821566 RepID=A0A142K913_9CAUD|nr:minor tail protein [Gordonia phage Yvonnetastic]AMS02596.1 minor tail protein [Gordonia phage Yvonnetastic]